MKKITFRKLYQRVDEGWYTNALVSYNSRVWITSTLTDTDTSKIEKGYQHYLFVDLWLIHLRLTWKTGYRPTNHEIRSLERKVAREQER